MGNSIRLQIWYAEQSRRRRENNFHPLIISGLSAGLYLKRCGKKKRSLAAEAGAGEDQAGVGGEHPLHRVVPALACLCILMREAAAAENNEEKPPLGLTATRSRPLMGISQGGGRQTQLKSKNLTLFRVNKISSCQLIWKSCVRSVRIPKVHFF